MTNKEILEQLWEIDDKDEFFLKGEELLNPKDFIEKIENYVLKFSPGITKEQLKSNSRDREFVDARSIVWYFLKKHYPSISFKILGEYYNRDHTTVINGINKVTGYIEFDKIFRDKINQIEDEIQRGENIGNINRERVLCLS